jgi:hypothetical protein
VCWFLSANNKYSEGKLTQDEIDQIRVQMGIYALIGQVLFSAITAVVFVYALFRIHKIVKRMGQLSQVVYFDWKMMSLHALMVVLIQACSISFVTL